MNFPRISIIVPSYNQGNYISETLASVVNQQYPNLELIVVDGGSADNSVDMIRKYEKNIAWWVSEKDKGQSDAINKGFSKATGEIISWINSDDLLLSGALQNAAIHFSRLPDSTGLIHGGTILFDEKKQLETRFEYLFPSPESYMSGMVFSQSAAFFKKKYLDKVGFLNNDLHYGMDYDLFMRLSLVCTFQPVKDVFSKYRLHEQSKSVAESNKFINDWKRSFVNLGKNLDWKEELGLLRETGFFIDEFNFYYPFIFQPDTSIVSSINREKAVCFHLGHVLKDLYWTGHLDEASDLMKMMEKIFPKDWIKEDPRLGIVFAKLKMPRFLLTTMKKMKNIFKKN